MKIGRIAFGNSEKANEEMISRATKLLGIAGDMGYQTEITKLQQRIQELEEENERLRNADMTSCVEWHKQADRIARLRKALKEIEEHTRSVCYTTDYEWINKRATEALKGEKDG